MSTSTPARSAAPAGARPGRATAGWVLTLVAGMLTLTAWALASPPNTSPDDEYHLPSIWCARGTDETRCLAVPDSPDARVVPALISGIGPCFAENVAASASCQSQFTDPDPAPTTGTERGNWGDAYPPLFYRFMSLLVSDHVAASVLLMRLMGGLVVVGVSAALAVALPRSRRLLASVPLLVTSVPLGLSLFASTNPSAWTILGVATLFPAAYVAFETEGRRRLALMSLAIVGALLASGSRVDGCLFVAMTAALVLILRWRRLREQPLPTLAAVGCLAVAAFFFLTSGHSSAISGDLGTPTEAGRSVAQLTLLNLGSLPVLWLGGFGYGVMGGLGRLDTVPPPLVSFCVTGVWFAAVISGLRRPYPAQILGLCLVGLALVVYPIVLLVQTQVLIGVVVQPRYVLPLVVLFTTIALTSRRGDPWRWGSGTFWVCVVALSTAQAIALHVQMRRYVTGLDVTGVNLDRGAEWWWPHVPGPTLVWLLGSVAFLGLTYGVLSQVREEAPSPENGHRDRTPDPVRPASVEVA